MAKKGGSNKEAKQARQDEQERQARIRAGTERINAIFDGGTTRSLVNPTGGAFDFGAGEYYNADGTRRTDKVSKFDNETIYGAPTTSVGNFTDDFFKQRRQSFLDYANPQLEDQYGQAQKELTFALTRSGLLDSSVRGDKAAELQKKYDLNKQQIADQALSYETEARNAVEDARSNLIATLNATGDAEGAASSAIARASALSKPTAYSPLTQLFADFTSGLGTQAALEKANYYSGGQTGVRHQTGLFAPRTNAVKVM